MSRFREEIGEQPAVAARKLAGSGPNVASIAGWIRAGIFDGGSGRLDRDAVVSIDSGHKVTRAW